jgi:hypothetical protein
MIKAFIPIQTNPEFDRIHVQELFKKGELALARRLCKQHGHLLTEFVDDIALGIRKLAISHRAGIALSFLFDNQELLQAKPIELLKSCFECRDYHGFLKNCLRFKIKTEFAVEIEEALTKIREVEAEAWRKKLAKVE